VKTKGGVGKTGRKGRSGKREGRRGAMEENWWKRRSEGSKEEERREVGNGRKRWKGMGRIERRKGILAWRRISLKGQRQDPEEKAGPWTDNIKDWTGMTREQALCSTADRESRRGTVSDAANLRI